MTAARIKKGLFAVLLVVAGYIWWGNIQLFMSAQPEDTPLPASEVHHTPRGGSASSLPYLPPKVNPFRKYSVSTAQTGEAVKPKPPELPPLHSTHKLRGIVGKGKLAQAIVQLSDRSTRILSTGDSLESWQLKEIKDFYVTFLNGKHHDTLFLDTKGL